MKNYSILLLLLALTSLGFAQQQTQSSFNYINPYFINKSYAGLDSCSKIFFQHKNQWVGINNAPTNTSLQAHTRLGDKYGIGIGINRWSAGLLSEFDLSVALARHFDINQDWKISPSINLGFSRYTLSADEAVVFDNDNYLGQSQTSSGSFYGDLGVLVTHDQLEAGISIPRLIATDPKFQVQNAENSLDVKSYLKAHASYDFTIQKIWNLKPMLVYRSIPSHGAMLDVVAAATYNNMVGLALGYRTNSGLLVSANFNLKDQFTIGYGYDAGMQKLASLGAGSHEILLGYKFCKSRKRKVKETPVKHYFLSGTVSDESGNAMENETVNLVEKSKGVQSKVVTDSLGQYKIEVLPGSNYDIQVNTADYVPYSQELSIDSALTENVSNVSLNHKLQMLKGNVVNTATGQPLKGVKVVLEDGTTTLSDNNGDYQMLVNKETLKESVSKKISYSLENYEDTNAIVAVNPGNYEAIALNCALKPIVKKDAPKIEDNKIVVNPIYFDVNSAKISDQAGIELDKIIAVMNEHPNMVLEVHSHTDCTGGEAANQKLSEKRANSCVSYISNKISTPTRITGKGMGESTPLTDCVCKDCSKDEHAKNRRTEFVILKMK